MRATNVMFGRSEWPLVTKIGTSEACSDAEDCDPDKPGGVGESPSSESRQKEPTWTLRGESGPAAAQTTHATERALALEADAAKKQKHQRRLVLRIIRRTIAALRGGFHIMEALT